MLYVNYKTRNVQESFDRERTLEWHVGETAPIDQFGEEEIDLISIYADGHEKQHILSTIKGIPYTEKRSCVWRGYFARFILDNMTP